MSDDKKDAPAADGGKKKKRVVVTPPCPPAVSTAYLLLRGAAEAVLGANCLETSKDLMQPTYIKENPVLSGKFGISVGKKLGFGELELPEDGNDAAQLELLRAIETAANRMIQENLTITCFVQTKEQAEKLAGNAAVGPPLGVFNKSHQKTKADAEVTVAFIKDCVLAIPPSVPFASTASLDKIVVETEGPQNSAIAAAKNSRRDATIMIKFHAIVKDEGPLAEPAPTLPASLQDDIGALCQNKVDDATLAQCTFMYILSSPYNDH